MNRSLIRALATLTLTMLAILIATALGLAQAVAPGTPPTVVMDANSIGLISGTVGGLAKLFSSFGLNGLRALLVASVLSTLGVALWVYSNDAWSRSTSFGIFAGWAVVLAATAGIFHIADNAGATIASIKRSN